MKNKLLYIALTVVLSAMPVTVNAAEVTVSGNELPDVNNSQATQDETSTEEWWKEKDNFGYVEFPHTVHSIKEGVHGVSADRYTSLPATYDARTQGQVSSIKNQNPWGTCWIFTTMGAMESSLLSQEYYSDVDLSEYHLINYNYQSVVDPLSGTAGDSVKYKGSITQYMDVGGAVSIAYHALANWMGAVDEDVAGYPTGKVEMLEHTTEKAYLQDIVHLQQMYELYKGDVGAVKTEIMNYGAVAASFYYDDVYFNENTAGYYNDVYDYSNHAILIVGWDDNYSKDNFLSAPSVDGAWLVKNSWGTYFGDDGYFWLSYEDTSLQDDMYVLVAETSDNYDHNYQYDGSYMDFNIEGTSAANVFQIAKGDTKEVLEAVSFQMPSTNTKYSIQIYTDLDNASNPTSGIAQLDKPLTGETLYQGYYTVKLPEGIELNPGQTFSVVIEIEEGTPVFVIEGSYVWNNTTYTSDAGENQSFLDYTGNGNWMDVGREYGGNLRIKAFTSDTNIEKDHISLGEEDVELTVGEEKQLKVLYNGVEEAPEDNDLYEWKVTEGDAVVVDSVGKITGKKQGTATITCTAKENDELQATVRVIIKTGFEDIRTTEWQYPFVIKMYENKVMTGKKQNIFGTNDKLSRAEFVTMLYAYAGKPDVTYQNIFKDVAENDWYALPVSWAYEQGITKGYGDKFGSADTITREQLVLMLYKYAEMLGKDMNYTPGGAEKYPDADQISGYAYTAVEWAIANGMISGRGDQLAPQGTTTRAECAAIMSRFMER